MKIKREKKSLIYKDTTQHTSYKKFEHSTNVIQTIKLFFFVQILNLYPFKLSC